LFVVVVVVVQFGTADQRLIDASSSINHISNSNGLLQQQETPGRLLRRTAVNLRELGYADHGSHRWGTIGLGYSRTAVLDGPTTTAVLELALASIQKAATPHHCTFSFSSRHQASQILHVIFQIYSSLKAPKVVCELTHSSK
jgi:hypothetical protein